MEDKLVAARKLVGELVKAEQIEVRRVEVVGRDLAKHVEALQRPPTGHELEAWLDEHAQVTELYASVGTLDELIYRYLTPPPPDVPISEHEHRHPELERQIRETLDAPEPYLVYADWLQEHGDPFGELIALGVAATTSGTEEDLTRFERFRKLHEARFLGGLKLTGLAIRWRFGVVHAIEELAQFDTVPLATWETLMRLRVCELMYALTLRRSCTQDLDRLLDECAAPTLRALTLDGFQHWPEHLMQRDLRSLTITAGRLAVRRDMFPGALARLDLGMRDGLSFETSSALPIRELRVVLSDANIAVLPQLRAPKLERLELSIDGGSAARTLKLLEQLELPELAHLAISDGAIDAKTFGKLAKLSVAKRLRSLALTNLEITDETIAAMTRTKRAFDELAEIDLSFNELSRDGLAAARELAPNVTSKRQNKRGDGVEKRIRRWAGTRLTVAEEIADPKAWKRAGVDGDLRWARYRGDDEYELYVTRDLAQFGCTCPSSYQPCKHVIALSLVAERTPLPEGRSDGIEQRVREAVARSERAMRRLVGIDDAF